MKINILIFACIIICQMVKSQDLPHYKLIIPTVSLDSMNAHPKDEIYYNAKFQVNDSLCNVEARFKGSTSLNYPKKSWAIKFPNKSNYFGATRINLHADYKDHSSMRNYLILKLFNNLSIPAPQVEHITFEVNGEPYGVYTLVEQIDEDLLSRYSRSAQSLYKANNHGGLLAPAVRDEYYDNIWEMQAGEDKDFNRLRSFLNKCLYWEKSDFLNNIESTVNTDNFLTFFAMHYIFVDMDNFTKNIFLDKNSLTGKYEFIPWDNEGSFGNNAYGEFNAILTDYNFKYGYTPEYEVVFKRLMEIPHYRNVFKDKMNIILDKGFTYLDSLIDTTYSQIKLSVYADTMREATDSAFDAEIPRLKWFMSNRKAFLQNNTFPEQNALTDFYCSNPYPNSIHPNVTFRVKSPVIQPVNMFFADTVCFDTVGRPFKLVRVELFDDGNHDDLLPNDSVYGNILNTNDFKSSLVPYSFTGAEQNYPPNGIFYVDYYGSKSFAINKGNADSLLSSRLKIGQVCRFNNQCFVAIINTSSTTVTDLSYFHLRTSNSFEDFMFRDNVLINPNETIYVAPTEELGATFFPANRSFSNLYFNISVGDSLKLFSSNLTQVISSYVAAINPLEGVKKNVVFNEINFKSGTTKPSGDWVEIYNPSDEAIDLTGWKYKDDNSYYQFSNGFTLGADSYLVIAEDILKFNTVYPNISNVVGSSGFGLSSSGEYILLVDNYNMTIDSVYYKTSAPWPTQASGTGHTLELRDFRFDNNVGENWYSDVSKFGSPGVNNSITTNMPDNELLLLAVFPNPTRDFVYIQNNYGEINYSLMTLQGQILQAGSVHASGLNKLDISHLKAGVYIINLTANSLKKTFKLVVK